MPRVVVVSIGLVLAACTLYRDHSGGDPDAAIDAPLPIDGRPPLPCQQEPPHPLCGESCGNNTIDNCWILDPIGPACPDYLPSREACDGTDGPTCAGVGYYGSGPACGASCFVTGTGCEACPPAATACATLEYFGFLFDGIALSGTHVAMLGMNETLILDGSTEVARPQLANAENIVNVPNGWLVSQDKPARLTPLAADGTIGTSVSAPSPFVTMAYAGGRVLVTFHEETTEWYLRGYITDATGAQVVAPFDIVPSDRRPSVTTDGTNFFVGSGGRLARVTPAGAVTVVDGYPADGDDRPPRLTWSGTTGWYITNPGSSSAIFSVQRFDATGALVGSSLQLTFETETWGFLADGSDLLVAHFTAPSGPSKLALTRIDQTGTAGTSIEVGAGEQIHFVGHRGADVVVVWSRPSHLQLSQVTP